MELYGRVLLIAMPIFLVAVLAEMWYGRWRGKDTYRTMDMISSMSSGITNVTKDVLGLSISLLTYGWMLNHLALFDIKATVWTYLIAFIVLDFQGYWVHRIAHQINFFWNKHAIHHSSEDFNLACALRQSISSFVNLFTFFLLPAAVLGVPQEVIGIVAPLHLFAQFWYHTQHIDRMGFLEKILVTPSHHRVHHAINPEYLDRNHSQIFIVWDKLFGTYQEELADVPPVYGITRPSNTWNPVKINFQHLWLLAQDAWRTNNFRDKLRIWFMPTGWRPADVIDWYPVEKIDDLYGYVKYEPKSSGALKTWAWIQLGVTLLFLMYFFGHLGQIKIPGIFYYGGFIFLTVYAYTELMDHNPYALGWEILKNGFGMGLLIQAGDWFQISQWLPGMQYVVGTWFILSTLVTAWFVFNRTESLSPVQPAASPEKAELV